MNVKHFYDPIRCYHSDLRTIAVKGHAAFPKAFRLVSHRQMVFCRVHNTPLVVLSLCNILTLNPAVNQETGASGQRYPGITLTCGRVEFGAIATPTGSRWMSNNYITRCHRRLELVGVGFRVAVRGSENQLQTEGLGPQDPV